MLGVGIDAGSRATKIVLMDIDSLEAVASGSIEQGIKHNDLAMELLDRLLIDNGFTKSDIERVVATGYGRNAISIADTTITEITCHARGVIHVVPEARTVVEIGGQDSKLLKLTEQGTVQDFAMNDRCAAGTGRFLEVIASQLGVRLEDLGEMSVKSTSPASISSMCIVFAETEIIGLLASGTAPEDIVAGVQNSIATRIATMAGKSITPPVVFTGGVAMVSGMDRALEHVLSYPVKIAPNPQMTGALGAAILASSQARKS